MKACLAFLVFFYASNAIYASPPDSLGLKVIDGKQYIIHEVQPAQGYFAISRLYNVPVDAIRKANPDLGDILPLGAIVFVPVMRNSEVMAEPAPKGVVVHIVKESETLYSISRQYDIPVAKLKSWNELTSDTIKLGHRLYVFPEQGSTVSITAPDTATPTVGSPKKAAVVEGDNDYKNIYKAIKSAAQEGSLYRGHKWKTVQESGIANWIDDGSLISDKFLALHANASSGTILKVTNVMNGRYAYVKVVGGLPASESNTKVKLTKSLIKKLGVIDEFFRVEIEYGVAE